MKMRIYFIALAGLLTLQSCKSKTEDKHFIVAGEIKNAGNQTIFLDRVYFSDLAPEMMDSANISNGKFRLSGEATEQGLFRLRIGNSPKYFFLINDGNPISFSGDLNSNELSSFRFSGQANKELHSVLLEIDSMQKELMEMDQTIQELQRNGNDSLLSINEMLMDEKSESFQNQIINLIIRSKNPVVCMVLLGFTSGFTPTEMENTLAGLKKRFPDNEGLQMLVQQYEKLIEIQQKPAEGPGIGSMAPDFSMNDENGNLFSLSNLRGKYVLVDFWASWCGPCRRENPNVVSAYRKFKDKNFTILGVSLDENKESWLNAIKSDKLEWKQVSELNGWRTSVVALYHFEGIPYNVLLDPAGRIVATGLRGAQLEEKLAEVLR